MVKIMENPIRMDDLGVPLFLENTHIGTTPRAPGCNRHHQDYEPFLGSGIPINKPSSVTVTVTGWGVDRWHLKIDPWKRRFLLETMIFRGYVCFGEGVFSIKCHSNLITISVG